MGVGGGGLRPRLLRALDSAALSRADVVVLDTDAHLAELPPAPAGRPRIPVVTPVGATAEWSAARRSGTDVSPRGRLRVIFFGLFTPLQGTRVIAAAAARLGSRGDIEFTLVGQGQDYPAARALAGDAAIRWLDWVPGAQLPELVAAHDVCLGIFGDTAKAYNVVPTKVFQGAAAGCAIVTSDTPPQRAAFGPAARYVRPADPAALADVLRELADDSDTLISLRRAATERAARLFTPAAVTADLCRVVERLAGRLPVPGNNMTGSDVAGSDVAGELNR